MLRWAVVLIAFSACKQEKPLGREIHLPPVEPAPARVELGECARTMDTFVVGKALPKPMYWVEFAPVEGGFGTFGTIGHGYGTISGGGFSHSASVPHTQLGAIQVTGADETWKAILRRYVKRSIMKLSYCYEKELLQHRDLEGTVVASLAVSKTGTVTSTITETFDKKVSSCMKPVFDAIELPKSDGPFTATVPVSFRPAGAPAIDRAAEARNATAIGAPNPLAQRTAELQACAREGSRASVVELTFDGKATKATVLGSGLGDKLAECVKKVAETTTKTSEATVMRCAFAIGSSAEPLVTVVMDADGRMTMNGEAVESLFSADYLVYAPKVFGLETQGPVGLEIHPDVVMEKVYPVLEDLHARQSAYVFIVAHAFGGKRLLGRTLPMLPVPKDKTIVSDALHVIRADRGALFLDDEPVQSLAQFAADLARLRREDGPSVQIRFERETTFGQFARAVDLAVEAGLTDWEL